MRCRLLLLLLPRSGKQWVLLHVSWERGSHTTISLAPLATALYRLSLCMSSYENGISTRGIDVMLAIEYARFPVGVTGRVEEIWGIRDKFSEVSHFDSFESIHGIGVSLRHVIAGNNSVVHHHHRTAVSSQGACCNGYGLEEIKWPISRNCSGLAS